MDESKSKGLSRRHFLQVGGAVGAGAIVPVAVWRSLAASASSTLPDALADPQTHLPGSQIPQFVDPLPTFVGQRVDSASYRSVVQEFQQQVLPASVYANAPKPFNGGTFVWGVRNGTEQPSWPGHTTIAHRGTPTTVTYVNSLPQPSQSQLEPLLTIDQTIDWANPENNPADDRTPYQGVIPVVFHLHGMEVNSEFDGTMMEWFTPDGIHGPGYNTLRPTAPNAAVYQYPNTQPPCTLFFHDHTRGLTRVNVYAGMVSQYWLRDQFDTGLPNNPLGLPAGNQEIELTFQDRMFDTNGQLMFPGPAEASNPAVHPFWSDNFFGDVMCVDGGSWPFLNVEPRRYRFRMLSFANMRTFRVWLEDADSGAAGPPIWEIGTDGGLLDTPVKLSADPNDNNVFGGTKLFMVITERADVIIDFTGMEGRTFTLRNDAATPFADTEHSFPLDPAVHGRLMQFRVNQPLSSPDNTYDPASGKPLRGGSNQLPAIVRLANPSTGQLGPGVEPSVHRQLLFRQFEPDSGTVEYLVNNTTQMGTRQGTDILVPGSEPTRQGGSAATDHTGMRMTEIPRVGDTEVWEVLNLTEEAHAVHIHLIQFQVLNRQLIDATGWLELYNSQFPGGRFFGIQEDGTAGLVDYPPGVYIPGYGPPNDYLKPNTDGALGGNPAFNPFLLGDTLPPETYEAGWKDTFHLVPNAVNRVVVRFAPQDVAPNNVHAGQNLYAIDPTTGPGYMWHCHMFEHEDNQLMHAWLCDP